MTFAANTLIPGGTRHNTTAKSGTFPPEGSTRGKILLIDDESIVLSAYGRALREAGFNVEQIASGTEGIAALRAGTFDLVICDVGLAGASGIDVLRAAHAHDPDLPVVLMTGGRSVESATEAVEHGALRYLLKPIDACLMRRTADDALRLRRIALVKRHAFELYGNSVSNEESRAHLSEQLDCALSSLHMAFQPIVRYSTRSIFAYEALVRTEHECLRRPDRLFKVAEELQRVHEVGRQIRRSVAACLANPEAQGRVFVNLHPSDLDDPELGSPDAPLSKFAHRVVLEVTERASLEGVDVRSRLAPLRALGYEIALDDLGAGYAGLSSFAQLRPEVVKLDMSLIRGIDTEPTKQRIVETMHSLCDGLGMLVIAEGVETRGECDTLLALGCDLLQGYLFAKPGAPFPAVTW